MARLGANYSITNQTPDSANGHSKMTNKFDSLKPPQE